MAQKGNLDIPLQQQVHSRGRQGYLAQHHYLIDLDQRDTFFASRREYCPIFSLLFWNLHQQGVFAITAHQGIVFSQVKRWHENSPYSFPFFDRRSRTSSGRHRGNRLQLGHRAAILPASGGGGVSRAATFNALARVARVLSRRSVVNFTWVPRRTRTSK